jgi:hypothetical protein
METNTTQTTPAVILRKTVFDLKTFGDVTLGLHFSAPPAFSNMAEALAYYGNDEAKVLEALTAERTEREKIAALESTPINEWHTFADEAETELNGKADVELADEKLVQGLVLKLAKQSFGFSKNATPEVKRAAKEKALQFIRESQEMRTAIVTMSRFGSLLG